MWKSLLMLLFAVSLGVIGQVNLKQGMIHVNTVLAQKSPDLFGKTSTPQPPKSTIERVAKKSIALLWNAFLTWKILLGICCYGLSMLIWLLILSRVDLSFAYPMLGVSYVLVVASAWLILGETISITRWVGTFVICIGVALVARS